MTKPWWRAGGAKPVVAADFGSGWIFGGESCSLSTDSVRAILSFDCELTAEQMAIASRLVNKGKAIKGHYQDWWHFRLAHRLR